MLICFIATIGFLFDIYELLMLPLIAKSALLDIAGIQPGTPEFFTWVGRLFFMPAIVGGIFGLMGGWLTDRWPPAHSYLVLLYAFAAFFAGFASTLSNCSFSAFQCLSVFVWNLSLRWRGWQNSSPAPCSAKKCWATQAFSSVGGLSVAIVNYWLATNYMHLPEIPSLFGAISDESNQAAGVTP